MSSFTSLAAHWREPLLAAAVAAAASAAWFSVESSRLWHATFLGLYRYVAPEVLTLEGYNQQVDVWSIGVITYLLLRGRLPFPINKHLGSPHFHQTYPLTFDGPVWRAISSSAKDLIRRMLDPDPRARITVEEALQHMWIKNPTAVINEANKTDPFDHITAAAAAAATAAADAARPLGAAAAPLTPGEDSGKVKQPQGTQPHAATGAPATAAAAAVTAATAATEPAAAGAPAAIAADTAANAKETAKAAAAAAHSAAAVAQAAAAAAALHAAATDEAFAAVQRNPSGESAARRAGPGEQQQQQQSGLATPSPASAVGHTSMPPNVAAAAPAEAASLTAASTSAPQAAGRPAQQGAAAGPAAASSSKPPAGP
ncbi:hypothetical protein Emed_003450 [Eimeria media]